MAIRWDWKEKVGVAHIEQNGIEYTFNLYQGNAFLIFLYEYLDAEQNQMYQMHMFFADKQHMNNILGLSKEYKGNNDLNTDGERLKSITIYKDKYSYTKDLVTALVKAFDELEITITKAHV